MARAWLLVAAIAAGGAPALTADVEIFWDGFDRGDLCSWSNPPVTTYHELEAFDEGGANDTLQGAETVAGRCPVIEGTIGDPYDPQGPGGVFWDTDCFEVATQGPARYRLRLERVGGLSLFQPYAEVLNTSEYQAYGGTPPGTPENDPALTTRDYYFPENGFALLDPSNNNFPSKDIPSNNSWYVCVDDDRNYFDECPEGLGGFCGDENDTYRLTLTVEPVAGLPAFPMNEEPIQVAADGANPIYRVDGALVDEITLTETVLDQLNPFFSDLDTRLFLVRRNGMQLETIAGNDDWAFDVNDELLHTDSKIGTQTLSSSPYFVVVDFFTKFVPDPVEFGLTIQFLQPAPSP